MREEVSLALSGMSSRDYVSQDSINLSTSSLFKGGGDFPSRRCLAEWLVKIRIRFLLFFFFSAFTARPPSTFASLLLVRIPFSPGSAVSTAEATNDAVVSIGNWQIQMARGALNLPIFSRGNNLGRCLRALGITRRRFLHTHNAYDSSYEKGVKLVRMAAILSLLTFFDETPVIFSNYFQPL